MLFPYATKCTELLTMGRPRNYAPGRETSWQNPATCYKRPTLIALRSALWLPVSGLDPAGTPVPACRAGVDDQSRSRSRRPETPAGKRVDLKIV